jgi:hypothetical protein
VLSYNEDGFVKMYAVVVDWTTSEQLVECLSR